MGGLLLRIKLWWDTSDRSQRMISVGGIAFVAVLLFGTIMVASRPKMSMLFGGLSPSEQGSVVTELQKIGIQADFDERGDVLVPNDKVADARIRLAAANKLPTTNGFGDTALAGIGIMNTPPVERERLKTLLEGKLADSIQTIDGIGSARVNLVLAEDSALVRESKPASASVTLSESAGTTVSKEQARSIAILVSNSVPGLTLSNVAVLDNRMTMLYDGREANTVGGGISNKLNTEIAEGHRRERDLQEILDRVYGPQAAIAKINLELDFDNRSYTQETDTPTDKMEKSRIEETMGGGSAGLVGGPAGTISNTPASATAPVSVDGNKSDYKLVQKQNDFGRDIKRTDVKESSGALKTMAIDVIANSEKVKDQAELENILTGYLGSKAGATGFTEKVTLVKFDTTSLKAAQDASSASAMQQKIQQALSLLPIIALFVVAIMVIKQLGKIGAPAMLALGGNGGGFMSGGNQLISLPSSSTSERGSEESAAQHLARTMAIATGEDPDTLLQDIKSIGKKINIPLEQIKKMSDERPEAVAQLIKSWLAEERK